MQPNGRPRASTLHPTSSITHKEASEKKQLGASNQLGKESYKIIVGKIYTFNTISARIHLRSSSYNFYHT